MTPEAVAKELFDRVAAAPDSAALVSEAELNEWPAAAVAALKSQRLLAKSSFAKFAVCPGCEEQCTMPVHSSERPEGKPVSFIICEIRSDISRVSIPSDQLEMWRISAEGICKFVAHWLGIQRLSSRTLDSGLREIGIVRGRKRPQLVCLSKERGLSLIIGSNPIPLGELISFSDGVFSLDQETVRTFADAATTGDGRHTPTTVRREARKLEIAERNEQLQRLYRKLRGEHPGRPDTWIANHIAKMAIGQDIKVDTIRKRMRGR